MTTATIAAAGERHLAHISPATVAQIAQLCLVPFAEAKPVLLKGAVKNPQGFFGEEHIQQMVRHPWLIERVGLFRDQKQVPPPGMDHATVSTRLQSPYTAEFIAQQRRTGDASLILRAVQRLPGAVRDMCMALAPGWPTVIASGFETSHGKQALETHWDVSPVVAFQTDDRKRWLIWEPILGEEDCYAQWPDRNGGSVFSADERARLTPGLAAMDVVVEPGDVLFTPLGWPHAPMAVGNTSLHVSLSPLPKRVHDTLGGDANHLLDLL